MFQLLYILVTSMYKYFMVPNSYYILNNIIIYHTGNDNDICFNKYALGKKKKTVTIVCHSSNIKFVRKSLICHFDYKRQHFVFYIKGLLNHFFFPERNSKFSLLN